MTGASSGIGAATAQRAGPPRRDRGARRAPDRPAGGAGCGRSSEAGGTAIAVPADMADATDVTLLAERATETFGKVDVLVNNAGAFWSRRWPASSADQIAALAQVNLLGAMLVTRAVLPGMLHRRHGAIVSVGSLSGRVAMEPLYSATKYGLRGFSLALRRQLAGTGVSRVAWCHPAASTPR